MIELPKLRVGIRALQKATAARDSLTKPKNFNVIMDDFQETKEKSLHDELRGNISNMHRKYERIGEASDTNLCHRHRSVMLEGLE